jgi:diacylglycerol kinase family enzyme
VTWEQWVSLAALVLALCAIAVGFLLLSRLAQGRAGAKPLVNAVERQATTETGRPAFVVNPIKVPDVPGFKALAEGLTLALGLREPLWYATTVEDPGHGQARQAVADGACVVVAAGGDGTVRAVASALAGGTVPMGLIPMGTGNLLARNLDLPLGDLPGLVRVALAGRAHAIDVGYLTANSAEAGEDPHIFLVMAGLGFDAAMVAGADHELKRKVGWFAYFLAGARHLHARRLRVRLRIDGALPQQRRLRSLLFANCGRLPGGIVLLPDAEIDDGWLDVAGIDTRGGLFGWAALFGQVILQGLGVRKGLPYAAGTIEFWRGHEVEVRCEAPQPVQVDGDLVGRATRIDVVLRPAALRVRTR